MMEGRPGHRVPKWEIEGAVERFLEEEVYPGYFA
jgi:hypothetical protein